MPLNYCRRCKSHVNLWDIKKDLGYQCYKDIILTDFHIKYRTWRFKTIIYI